MQIHAGGNSFTPFNKVLFPMYPKEKKSSIDLSSRIRGRDFNFKMLLLLKQKGREHQNCRSVGEASHAYRL
jgi:hypothetical protein